MNKLLTVLLLALCFTANATTYYFSASGDDGDNGISTSTPWRTLNKLNSVFSSLSQGDNVLFNRGDVFYGSIVIKRGGSSGSPITIGAYGTGSDPVITGFTTISGWTNLGNNIWESTSAVSSLSSCNMVVINGVNVAMGRYPNTGYLTYQSAGTNKSITSSSLNSTNWKGAEAVIRKNDWVLDRCVITNHSGTTLTYTDPYTADNAKPDYGFFIQNDSRTLDRQNEWYYNPSTKKIRIYSAGTPSNVQIATQANLLSNNGYGYITIDNITFTGSSNNALYFYSGSNDHSNIQNCTISFCGQNGIYLATGSNSIIDNNKISNCNRAGIESDKGTGNIISNNVITNIGVIKGQSYDASHNDGIYASSTGVVIRYNTIRNVSYDGIFLSYLVGSAMVQYNFIDSTNLVLDDGGGIYTAGSNTGMRTIDHNIVLNTVGNREGTNNLVRTLAGGIYLDEPSSNITVTNNTVANGLNAGIKMHRTCRSIVNNNTSFNNATWQIYLQNATTTPAIYSNVMNNNIFFAKAATQWTLGFVSVINDISDFGTADNNYYARPVDDNVVFNTYQPNTSYANRNLASWQTFTGQDIHSRKSPKTITNVNDVRFEYNATTSSRAINLDGNYIDVRNVSYNGTITLAPYTSAVLIRNGAATNNQSPTANAGSDQTIALPASTVTLLGSGTDPDGTIAAYDWTKISGPTPGTLSNDATAVTTVTGLVQGVYQFQLKVTDNDGATGLNTVQITVNAAGNSSPTANAGPDQTIALPASTVTLLGSGADPDGTIAAYDWTKISGPTAGAISNDATAVTTVTGLVQGVYQFQLKVTDNDGATGFNTVQVTVNVAGNRSPVANAGSDQSVTLPTNTVTLFGDGTDADGAIATYSWTKISGPASGAISNTATAVTDVIDLVEGVYQFQLKVTDNDGATGVNTVQVTVNPGNDLLPAVNPPNTVNGLDYNYYEGSYAVLPVFSSLIPFETGTATDFDISLARSSTTFAFNFTGYIDVPSDGQYTFYTYSDDGSSLYIDNVPVVNNDGVHGAKENSGTIGLEAGKHAISVGYLQEDGSTVLNVSYDGPGFSKRFVPPSALYRISGLLPAVNPANTVNGLDYDYYEGAYVALPIFSLLTPDETGTSTNFDISSSNSSTLFAYNFSGYIDVPGDGQYIFYTNSDDGSKLYIDNVLVVNNDGLHGAQERSGSIGLQKGKHAISVGYFQAGVNRVLSVSYDGPGFTKRVIPASALYRISTNGLLPAVYPANTVNGLDYKYYAEGYDFLPVFSQLTPDKTGTSTDFNISLVNTSAVFAYSFTGYITVPGNGQYTFYTTSDDGSNLYIDNVLVVNNDGLHGAEERSGNIGLEAGKHAISVGYFQAGVNKTLSVSYEGPGFTKRVVSPAALYRVSPPGNLLALGSNSLDQTITSSPEIGVKAFPNPFADYIKINIGGGAAGKYKLTLADASGKVLWTVNGNKNAGAFQRSINTSTFQRGVYYLRVIQNDTSSVIKLVK